MKINKQTYIKVRLLREGMEASINAFAEIQSEMQEELDALLPSVLDRAFKGDL